MSYTINYSTGTNRKYPQFNRNRTKFKVRIIIFAGLLVASIALLHMKDVRHFLLPGDPVVTEQAIIEMVGQLQAGESVRKAVTVFCQEVIQNGLAEQ